MSAEENKQAAKEGYDAFAKGDAEGAMANISDSVEWVVGGDSSVSGIYRGKEEVGKFWAQLGEKGFQGKPLSSSPTVTRSRSSRPIASAARRLPP